MAFQANLKNVIPVSGTYASESHQSFKESSLAPSAITVTTANVSCGLLHLLGNVWKFSGQEIKQRGFFSPVICNKTLYQSFFKELGYSLFSTYRLRLLPRGKSKVFRLFLSFFRVAAQSSDERHTEIH